MVARLSLALAMLGAAFAALTPVHVVFLTDCTMYSNWQSLGMIWSFRMSGQPGSVSRVMCCTPEEKAKYDAALQHEVDTWVAPSFTIHPVTKDHYAAYNKPEAVIDWLEHVTPKEDYVLVLDSDMILRKPFLVEDMHPSPGWAVGARYTYMIGVANELAVRHIPEIAPRNDTFAGPLNRRADQVGGFFFVHRDDLKRMSKLWLKYTEDVRADPEVSGQAAAAPMLQHHHTATPSMPLPVLPRSRGRRGALACAGRWTAAHRMQIAYSNSISCSHRFIIWLQADTHNTMMPGCCPRAGISVVG